MRIGNIQNAENSQNSTYKILAVDDEAGIIDSLSIFLKRSGYSFTGITDPVEAIERIKTEHFDLLLLDFIMTPLHGDQVVEEIRKFNKELYILLLTGHKDLAPPLETIRRLDIQGYCEKSDKFDQLLLLIESGIKSVEQMRQIKAINEKLADTFKQLEQAYMESIQTVRYTVEAKDTYTRGHSDRVSEYSVLIGKKLEQYNVFWNKIFEYYRELNSIFILIPSISLFYIFKEIDIGCNKIINYFASISLGVYLFHESNFMRYRLWHEILTIEKIQKLPGGVITGLVISIVSFYAITAIIEFFRINLIEKNILKSKTINKLFNKINNYMSI